MPEPASHTSEHYERLGREVEKLLVNDYVDLLGSTRKQILRTALRGFVAGLAGVIGGTLGVAILIYILSQLQTVPLVGQFAHNVTQTIQAHEHTTTTSH